MNVVITEKPDQAKDIAAAMGNPKKETGYISVNDYCITWAFGHVFTIDDTAYQSKSWKIEELPLLPKDFDYIPVESKKHQIGIIHNLIAKASKIIVATDAGREGELIAREILSTFNGKLPPSFRFWTSEALTKEVVNRCIQNAKPLANYDSLFYSAKARQISDWVVGINLTRLFSVKGNALWSVGRVQTPTLSIIVNREKEIKNFKPTPFTNIICTLKTGDASFVGKVFDNSKESNPDRFSSVESAEHLEILRPIPNAVVDSITKEEKRNAPPPLYSLTLLQRAANRKFGFSAKQTLEIAQSLYEKHKCTSYPRTESRYLAESSREKVFNLLNHFSPDLSDKAYSVGKRVFDDAKLTDHHAIIPLADYSGNDENESKVYNLIKYAFIAAFMDDFVFESTKVALMAKPFHLPIICTGIRVVSIGWKSLYQDEGKDNETNELPKLAEGQNVSITNIEAKESFTKPPSYITEDSLLGFMEKLNLGTPATRDSIIEKLLSTSYIQREKKNLLPTPKGCELITKLDGSAVANAELTSHWENNLDLIYKNNLGNKGLLNFVEEIHLFTKEEVNRFINIEVTNHNLATPKMLALAKKLATENQSKDFDKKNTSFDYVKSFIDKELAKASESIPCPCGKGNITSSPKAWNCDGCNVIVWKEIAGKKLNLKQAISLFNGDTLKLKGFKSKKTKKSFDASLKVENGKVIFVF